MGRYPRAGSRERVAQRNRTAVDVQSLARERQLTLDRARLGGKRLVHLDEIHVAHRHSGFSQRGLRGWHGSYSHNRRIDPRYAPGHQAAERLELALTRKLFAGDHHRRRTVADSRRVSRGDDSALAKNRLERSQPFVGGLRSHVLVLHQLLRLSCFWIGHRNGNYFIVEDAFIPRRLRKLL